MWQLQECQLCQSLTTAAGIVTSLPTLLSFVQHFLHSVPVSKSLQMASLERSVRGQLQSAWSSGQTGGTWAPGRITLVSRPQAAQAAAAVAAAAVFKRQLQLQSAGQLPRDTQQHLLLTARAA